MADKTNDQLKFWQAVLKGIAGKPGMPMPNNIILASQGITCQFGGNIADANAQLVQLGNTIPRWAQTWDGVTNNSFFGLYQSWLDQIHPPVNNQNGTSDQTALDKIEQKIIDITDGADQIAKAQYRQYLSDYCLQTSADGVSCTTWMPGYSASAFTQYWQSYQKSPQFKAQVDELHREFGDTLDGLSDQYDAIAEKLYGPDYREIAEAKAAVRKADPKNFDNNFSSDKERNQYQVQINEDGVKIWATRFTLQQGQTFASFAQWLKTARDAADNGADPEVEIELSNSIEIDDSSSWQFSFGANIPVEDFFMIGLRGGASQDTLDVSKYDFKAVLSYQSILNIPLGPMDTWYDSSMFAKYKGYKSWSAGSAFAGETLWGPSGVFNLRVAGIIVGYQPYLKMEVSNWTHSEVHTKWSEEASFSILGLINLGSESASGETNHVQYTSTDTGFELKDTSGQPQIIALVVEPINYP